MLFNERMSESCLYAKKWLIKPGGVLSWGRGVGEPVDVVQ